MHGAGVIEDITEIDIAGKRSKYYEVHFALGNMVTNIPVDNAETIGIRDVIAPAEAKKVLEEFIRIPIADDLNWNKRQRENLAKLKSGDIYVVLGVLKELMYRDLKKGLSTSERKTLASAKQIVVSEIVLSGFASLDDVEAIMQDTVREIAESEEQQ